MKNGKIKTQPFDCMQYFYGKVQEPRIRCMIRFQGRISETALKRAAHLSVEAVPPIGCSFNENLHRWEKRVFSDDDLVRLIKVPAGEKSPALSCLLSSVDPGRGPQLKIQLVREEESDTLCIVINHMVCDGAGFKEYLYLLGSLYSQCEKAPGYSEKPEPPGERGFSQLLRNLSLGEKLNLLFSKPDAQKPDPALRMPIKGDPANPMIVVARIEKEPFDAIRRFAKGKQATVNDVLLTAYFRALSRTTGCRNVTVPCPVDLRKYARAGQRCGICNLTGNYRCSVEIQKGEPFDETLRKVSDQMRAQKQSNACLKGPMQFHLLFHALPFHAVRSLFYRISPVPVTSYTNLGILDDQKLRFGGCVVEDAWISTAVKKAPYFQLSVSTYRGCCTLTSSLYGTKEDTNFVNGFLNRVKNELTCRLRETIR